MKRTSITSVVMTILVLHSFITKAQLSIDLDLSAGIFQTYAIGSVPMKSTYNEAGRIGSTLNYRYNRNTHISASILYQYNTVNRHIEFNYSDATGQIGTSVEDTTYNIHFICIPITYGHDFKNNFGYNIGICAKTAIANSWKTTDIYRKPKFSMLTLGLLAEINYQISEKLQFYLSTTADAPGYVKEYSHNKKQSTFGNFQYMLGCRFNLISFSKEN